MCLEPMLRNKRSHHNEKPVHHNEEQPPARLCDFLGEKIASVLGISTPKYQYAIDEYYRMKKEEEEEEEENRMSEEAERQYQQNKLQADSIVQSDQPETLVSSSFVNLNFEMEGDCEVIMESKQNPVSVPP
ncbi:hypothetical protein J1605_018228 [Eschrichtius robustus]|uniref:Protein FAM177A1 n=1 Tax=Eschrichtius robustus TaxID=9764 RepID=A0AB34HYL2_ESCRO|nr:hypothetical protein J1605_018228 [Eschrichtius robustus]